MAFDGYKIMTFANIKSLIDDEGFAEKNSFSYTSKVVATRDEVKDAMFLDDSGGINSLNVNQGVRRNLIVSGVPSGRTPAMYYSTGSSNETKSCDIVNTHVLHNGANTVPMLNDYVYDYNTNVALNGNNLFYSFSRYPGATQHVYCRINTLGKVIYTRWCTSQTSTPTGLVASGITNNTFTLTWSYGGQYLNPGLAVYKNGSLYQVVQSGTSLLITGQVRGASNTWTVRAYDESDSSGTYKESAGLVVDQDDARIAFNMGYIPNTNSSLACADASNSTYYHDGAGTYPTNGDYVYSTSSGGSPINGNNKYYKSWTGSRWLYIGTAGNVVTSGGC